MLTLSLILRMFRSAAKIQRKRMILTVTAICWGTISIILLLSFGGGLKNGFLEGMRGLGDGIVIVWMGQTGKTFAGMPSGRPIRLRPEDVDLAVRHVPEIVAATGEMTAQLQLVNGRNASNRRVVGVHPAFGELRAHVPQPGGRFLNELDQQQRRRVVFLGELLAEELFGQEDPVGRTVHIRNTPFLVIGVMEPKRQNGMYGGPDSRQARIPISTFETMFGRRTLTNLVFLPASPEVTDAAKRGFMEVLGAKYRFDPTDTRALHLWDTMEQQDLLRKLLGGIEIFLGIIGALTLIIGGVGVANIMFAAVKQRTREIGVKMALGARRVVVMGGLVLESLGLTFLGGALGILVGAGLVRLLARLQAASNNEALSFLGTPTFSMSVAVTTVVLLGLVGFLAGFFPARRAVTIQPAAALRYE